MLVIDSTYSCLQIALAAVYIYFSVDFTLDFLVLTPETNINHSTVFSAVAFVLCSGGDRQGKTASKQPADPQPNQSTVAGTSDSTAQKKDAVRCTAAKVPQNVHTCTYYCTIYYYYTIY